jgi:hypothetical protein
METRVTKPLDDISQRTAAVLATIGVVITLVGVGIAMACGAPPDLARAGDATTVVAKITSAGGLFRVAVLGWVLTIIGDVVRAWALYVFFRGVNKSVAMLAAWWMLLHDAVFAFALVGLVVGSEVAGGAGAFGAMAPGHAQPLLMALLEAHRYGFNIGLTFFSFHLLLNGYLVIRSGYVPKVLGVLLVVAFVGYLVDSGANLLFVDPPAIINKLVMLPNTVGELALIVWLAFRGGRRVPRQTGEQPVTE